MDSFVVAFNAVLPFLIYISFGYAVRELGVVDEKFMVSLNRVIYTCFFPFLMFWNIYSNSIEEASNLRMITTVIVSVLAVIALAWIVVPRIVQDRSKASVIIQGIYRSNFLLFAVPLAQNVFGDEATAMAAILVAIVVPIYNVTAILLFEYFRGGRVTPRELFKNVIKNPLLMGALAGALFLLAGIELPGAIQTPISQFSDLTTPLALFVLGGTLKFSSVAHNLKYHIPTLCVKMLILPAVMLLVGNFLGLLALERFLYFVLFAGPIAAASYSMACNMGGDGDLAGELVVLSTAVSVVSLFLWIFFMNSVGILY